MSNNNDDRGPVSVPDLVAGYRGGATLEELGRRYQVSVGLVRSRLLGAGVRLRPPGRRPVNTRVRSVVGRTVTPGSVA